jgi:hypothetical protein
MSNRAYFKEIDFLGESLDPGAQRVVSAASQEMQSWIEQTVDNLKKSTEEAVKAAQKDLDKEFEEAEALFKDSVGSKLTALQDSLAAQMQGLASNPTQLTAATAAMNKAVVDAQAGLQKEFERYRVKGKRAGEIAIKVAEKALTA